MLKSLNLAKIVKFTYYRPCNWQFWLKFGQMSAQWTVVIIISSKYQLFIPLMLCESLESVG